MENHYTKLDREFLLELSRIGGNINQIAKAINTDIASSRPLDAARLLHLLIGIDQTLRELKNDCSVLQVRQWFKQRATRLFAW